MVPPEFMNVKSHNISIRQLRSISNKPSELDVPPLDFGDDQDDSKWSLIAKMIFSQQGKQTLKYIK